MKQAAFAALLLQASLSAAHFGLNYPVWRADSLSDTNESISQWTYPCANVEPMQNASQPRTPWPLQGGSISLDLHHPWSYLFVNIGFGSAVTNFNVSLNPEGGRLINETGNGTFCWNRLPLPSVEILGLEITEGTEASIQVVTSGESGASLYNCADIVFTANATTLVEDQCFNSTGVTAESVQTSASNGESTATTSGSAAASSTTNSAASLTVSSLLVVVAAGLMAI